MDGGSSSESSDSSVGFVSDSSSSLHTSAVITDLSALSGASESSETSAVGSSRGASPSTLAPSFLDCADGSLDADVGVLAVAGDDCPDLSTSGTCSSGLLAVDLDNADAGNGAADDRAASAGQAMEGVDASDDTAFAGMTDGGGDACLCPDGGSDAPASPAGCGFAAAGNDGAQTPVCGTELPAKRRLVYKQQRPGPKHGQGGRKKGSGRETKKNFGRGLRRVVGAFLGETSSESLSAECGVSSAAARGALKMLKSWAAAPGSEEIWMVPCVFGVVARWGEWGRDMAGKNASVCVWLDAEGCSRCTCVEADAHQDNIMHERPTACQHAGVFDAMLDEIAACLGTGRSALKQHTLHRVKQGDGEPDKNDVSTTEGMTFHVLGPLYVAVCPSPFGVLPVPVYLNTTRSSCGICPGARTRTCSHLSVAQACGAPHKPHRSSAQSSTRSLELSSVSRLPIPLHDCVAAVRFDADVSARVQARQVFVLGTPKSCLYCTQRGLEHELGSRSTRLGALACTAGFCRMEVHLAKCSSCEQWVSKEGRDDHIVMLTTTTAGTVVWARSMSLNASEGMALTTSTTRWLRTVQRRTVSGVLPWAEQARSGRMLRDIVLVALKLMARDLPPELFSCRNCMDADGRYKCVSADSIWVGFGSGADHVRFEHIAENVPVNTRAVRAAYLIRGESVRRVLRDVMMPRKDIKLLSKTTRAAEIAVGLLLPDALPPERIMDPSESEKAISALLGSIFDIRAAAGKLLVALKGALLTFKPRNKAEHQRRLSAARHLAGYITRTNGVSQSAGVGASGNTTSAHPPAATTSTTPAPARSLPLSPAVVTSAARAAPGGRRAQPQPAAVSTAQSVTSNRGTLARVAPSPAVPTSRVGKRAKTRPACGRQPFQAGKGDVDAESRFLLPSCYKLSKDGRRELLSFITAITIDSVALPFRPSHAEVLRQIAGVLRGENAREAVLKILASATTSKEHVDGAEKQPMVSIFRELRFLQLGIRSSAALSLHLPHLFGVLAGGLVCAADCIDLFVLEWRAGGPAQNRHYQDRWSGAGRSTTDLRNEFKAAHPKASSNHEVTGMCAPSLPQCRPEPFLWEEVLSTGMCSKHYAKAHKFSPGVMTFCCGCKHPLILAFSVLDRKEAPQVLLNMLLTRFARLPRFLIYDFACGAFRVALGKIGWLLMDCTIVSDRFHIFNHLCSDAFDPRSYAEMDGVDSGAPEQRNAPIRRIQTTLQGMGVVPYTNLLAYQTAILNHEAQVRWQLGVTRLPEKVDLAGEYFTRYPCQCCDEDGDENGCDGEEWDDASEGEGGASDDSSDCSAGGAADDVGVGDGADGSGEHETASSLSEDVSLLDSVEDSSVNENGDDSETLSLDE